jgi:shikimate dehydrogenase
MRHYGLIGYPLGHSFSASYFGNKFSKEGIEASYRNFPLSSIEAFPELVSKEPALRGLNVTVPYKQEIIPFLDELGHTAKAIQAVNTISFRRSAGGLVLKGDNTDVTGFRQSLEQHLESQHESALVLGTGGSSRAVYHVLEQLGVAFTRVSRSAGEGQITYEEVYGDLVAESKLIINTTPLGMFPQVDTCPPIPYEGISGDHLLFDLVYNPELTLFLARGEKQGAKTVNGHDMLINQAEASWAIWNASNTES